MVDVGLTFGGVLRGNAIGGVASIWRASWKVVGALVRWCCVSGSTCRPFVLALRGEIR
jgi:hypothetical protein